MIGIPGGEGEGQGAENQFEKVMMENFPNLRRERFTQIQETQRVPLQDTSYLRWQNSKTKRES